MAKNVKYVVYCAVAFVLLIAPVIAYYVGRERGRHIAFIETNRAYYEHRGGRDLLDQFSYPDPFVRKYIEKHGLTTRQEIDAIMQGYVGTWTVKHPDGSMRDVYEFNMGGWFKHYIFIEYDSAEKLDIVDEWSGGVFLRR